MDEARDCLSLLSGRSHWVYSTICLASPGGKFTTRCVETKLRFKRLSREDIDSYIACGEWRGKAGGYAVQGRAGGFIIDLHGSYTGVVGLPLYETLNLLNGLGWSTR